MLNDASRTGAPALALRWLRWVAASESADVEVWLDRGGSLAADFALLAPLRTRPDLLAIGSRAGRGSGSPAMVKLADRLGRPRSGHRSPPIVVANTLAAWRSAASVRRRTRLVVWVHELDHVAEQLLPPPERHRLLAETDHLIAAGSRVGEMLIERWHVPPAMVTVIDPFIDDDQFGCKAPSGHHHIVSVGSLVPRKGPDAFVAAMALIRARHPELRAAWVGGPLTSPTADAVRCDIAAADLEAHVELLGELPDATAVLPRDGIVVHTAREDPAPLAVLEAAVRAIPVATWNTGGAADLLDTAGLGHLVAPAGDLIGLAERVHLLLSDPAERTRAGRALQEAVGPRRTSVAGPRVLAAICAGPG